MEKSLSERRLAENQVFFRQSNQQVAKGLDELQKLAEATDQKDLSPDTTRPIQFYCECSDENCKKRISLQPAIYSQLHKNSDQFILLPGHDIPAIERTVQVEESFIVVEKYNTAPTTTDNANPTDVDNV